MKTRAIFPVIAVSFALAGCTEELNVAPLADDGWAYCGEADTADTTWIAGCASYHNLAVLAEEPDDLILPRPEEPRALTHQDRIFDGYGQSPRPGLRPARTQTAQAPEPQPMAGEQ